MNNRTDDKGQRHKSMKVPFLISFLAISGGMGTVYVFAIQVLDIEWWVPLTWMIPILICSSLIGVLFIKFVNRYSK